MARLYPPAADTPLGDDWALEFCDTIPANIDNETTVAVAGNSIQLNCFSFRDVGQSFPGEKEYADGFSISTKLGNRSQTFVARCYIHKSTSINTSILQAINILKKFFHDHWKESDPPIWMILEIAGYKTYFRSGPDGGQYALEGYVKGFQIIHATKRNALIEIGFSGCDE